MELINRMMPKDYILVDTGDWHVGPLNCDLKGIRETINFVQKTKNAYMI